MSFVCIVTSSSETGGKKVMYLVTMMYRCNAEGCMAKIMPMYFVHSQEGCSQRLVVNGLILSDVRNIACATSNPHDWGVKEC